MKILFAIKTLTNAVGGAERICAFLASEFAKDKTNFNVAILTFDGDKSSSFYPLHSGVLPLYVPLKNTVQKTTLFEFPLLLLNIRKKILLDRPDVIIGFMHSMFIPLQLALLGTGIKVVLSEHTTPAYYKNRKFEFFLLILFSIFARKITIASNKIKNLYPALIKRKMVILINPVTSDFQKADTSNSKIILSVGRLNKDKDFEILIKSFFHLNKTHPEWTLKIYGDGPEKENLEKLIDSLNLSHCVLLEGVTKNIDAAYKTSSIFVIPSRYESFGLVVAEAMSHALPVIGFSDCTGVSDIIEDRINGILVKKRDAQDLFKAMMEIVDSEDLRLKYGDSGYKKSRQWQDMSVLENWKNFIWSL